MPRDEGTCMSYRYKLVLGKSNRQLVLTNAQGVESTPFLLFACFLFLFCFAECLALLKDAGIKRGERQGCSVQCRDTHWYI